MVSGRSGCKPRILLVLIVLLAVWVPITFAKEADVKVQKTVDGPRSAKNTVIRLVTQLGVEKEIPVNAIRHDNLVIRHLLGYWNILEAHFVLKTEEGVYLVIPQELFRLAEMDKGVHIVTLSNGKQFRGELVGSIQERDTAAPTSGETNMYPLADCVKVEMVSIDEAYLKNHSQGQSKKGDAKEKNTKWKISLPEMDDAAFMVINPRLGYKYFSTVGYAIGGQDIVKETKSFQVHSGEKTHLINVDDFIELSFAKTGTGIETITLKSNTGITTTGTVAIEDAKRGDLFLIGGLTDYPGMSVAINVRKWKLQQE